MSQQGSYKLSICISTFNRAAFIGATLESIVSQATDECEIVVLDCASTDDTQKVVAAYCQRFARLRYIRQEHNGGLDHDFDRAVELARGDYCWLMSDDDLLRPGAVAAVLGALRQGFSLVLVNAEFRDFTMSKILHRSLFAAGPERVYGPEEMDRLFSEAANCLKYIGCVVIERALWLSRERERYYGSLFIHVGVVFQKKLPRNALVITEPFISIRAGNTHTWTSSKVFEIHMFKWPTLVWSLAPSESAKTAICRAEPWRDTKSLLWQRARGTYSLTEYRRWIRPRLRSTLEAVFPAIVAVLPGVLLNTIFACYFYIAGSRSTREIMIQVMRESRFHLRNRGIFGRKGWT